MAGCLRGFFFAFLWTILLAGQGLPQAHAYEIEDQPGYLDPTLVLPVPGLVPAPEFDDSRSPSGDRLRRFDRVLEKLGIPEEAAPGFYDFPAPGSVSFDEVAAHFPTIDPDGALRKYLGIHSSGVSLFRDFFSSGISSSLLEFFLPFRQARAKTPREPDSSPLIDRLRKIGMQVKQGLYAHPLSGLRVVIDPGHMGSEEWDHRTGKFVSVGGKTVSEGDIARSTALLLAGELEDLGAEVILTRLKNGPVARTPFESFDPTPFLNQYFYNSLDSWMRNHLALPEDRYLASAMSAPEVEKAFSPSQRTQYFISGEDLEARARIIDESLADLVIDIHYDASKSNELQSGDRSIEAFVPGGVRSGETGSRVTRSHHLKHLLEVRRWRESVDIASAMVNSMAETLKLPLLTRPEFLTSVKVKDGVYARNLYLNRRTLRSLMVYLECLHYDHVREFPQLTLKDRVGTYRGETFAYPRRIDAVVAGAKEGILRYFRNLE